MECIFRRLTGKKEEREDTTAKRLTQNSVTDIEVKINVGFIAGNELKKFIRKKLFINFKISEGPSRPPVNRQGTPAVATHRLRTAALHDRSLGDESCCIHVY